MNKTQNYLFTFWKINLMITNIQMLEGEAYSQAHTSVTLINSTSLNMQSSEKLNIFAVFFFFGTGLPSGFMRQR